MNKVFILLLSLFSFQFAWAQSGQQWSPGSLTQDSVKTHIVNGKPETTFYVKASDSGLYSIRFWLMGVRHSNGGYSSYILKVDNDSIDQVLTDRGDWHSYGPSHTNGIYLNQGSHTLSLVGSINDVPNAECVKKYIYGGLSSVGDTTRYAYRKLHQGANFDPISFISDTLLTNYRILNFHYSSSGAGDLPAIQYNAELNKEVFYSFYRLEYFTENQVVTFETSGTNLSHALNLFANESTLNNSWVAFSNSLGSAFLTVTIPHSGFYYVLIRTNEPTQFGTCNLCINNEKCFDNVPICSSMTEIHNPFSLPSCCFVTSDEGDPFICLIRDDGDGRVYAYNDDYPLNSSLSTFNWGNNSRINTDSCCQKWLFTTTKSYPSRNIQKCDIFVGCKTGPAPDGFFSFMNDDVILSDDPTGYNEYNCISWSGGIWWAWINPFETLSEFDDFYEGCGFYRTSSSPSAFIDIWKKADSYTHASIKSKAHPYAASYDWESKMGHNRRVFHPRYALQEDNNGQGGYGEVVAHYTKDLHNSGGYPGPGPILDFSFSSSEMTKIENETKKISDNDRFVFWNLYDRYRNDSVINCFNDTRDFDKARVYKILLNYCLDNPNVIYFLFKEASSRSVFPLKLLQDIAKYKKPELLINLAETCKRINKGKTDKTLLSVQAEEILLSKALLSDISSQKEIEDLAESSISCNNDYSLSISRQGKTTHLSFVLNESSQVSLILVNMNSFETKRIIKEQYFSSGSHSTSFNIVNPGLYSIGLIVNGGINEKKIRVDF